MKVSASGWRRFWRLSLPDAGWMFLGLVLACATLAAGLGLGAVSGGFLTATALAGLTLGTAQSFNVFLPSAAIRFLSITRTASRWLERVVTHDATFRILGRLRVWLYSKLSGLSPRQLGGLHAADVLSRLTKDIDLLDNVYLRLLLPTAAALITLGLFAGLVGVLAPLLVWPVMALFLGVVVLLPFLAFRSGFELSEELVADHNRLRTALLDITDGLDDLALHGDSWRAARGRVAAVDDARLERELSFQRRGSAFRALLLFLTGLGVWGLVGLSQVSGAAVPGPLLVAMVVMMMGTVEVIQGLPRAWMELAGTLSAAARVANLAGQNPSVSFASDGGNVPLGLALAVKNLTFGYDTGTNVLRDVSFEIPEGEHWAVVGPSGGGKSTLAALLSRLEPAPAETITLGGTALEDLDEPTFRRLVAANTQDPWIFTATVAANLRLADPQASDDELWEVIGLVGLTDQVSRWPEGLDTWIEEGGTSLSGGERRRLAAARVLLRRCPVLILDEPTEGLDDAAAERLVTSLRARCRGKTIVWISHRRHGIAGFDRIVAVENGQLTDYLEARPTFVSK